MGVREPQEAQEADEHNLAEQRIAVDQEGNKAAHHGSLDQIKNSHTTVFKFCRSKRRLCDRLPDKAAV
jgi:hypothetical protein